jgi:hypothetical protein
VGVGGTERTCKGDFRCKSRVYSFITV